MILITGAARSGTSLTARILAACGAGFGRVNDLHENVAVRDGMLKPYLANRGFDPRGQRPLPDIAAIHPLPDWRVRVLRAVGSTRPAYKDAKIAITWPLWMDAFPDAVWVLVRRDDDAIIRSCMRTSFMNAHSQPEGWRRWIDYHHDRFGEMRAALRGRLIEFWPLPSVLGDAEIARPLVEHLGLSWNPAGVRAAIAEQSI